MAQEYTVKSWKQWIDQETDEPVRDDYGNHKGSVTFDEHNSEPVDATFKEPPKIGDKKFGDITEYQTKAGRTRLKFKSAQRPKFEQGGSAPSSGKTYQPRDEEAIRAQFAIKTAVATFDWTSATTPSLQVVEGRAKEFYAMVNRVKASRPIDQNMVDAAYSNDEPLPEYQGD